MKKDHNQQPSFYAAMAFASMATKPPKDKDDTMGGKKKKKGC